MMRRGPLILLALIPFVAARPADAQVLAPGTTTALARASVDDIVARMLSFDRNSDGKVQSSELLERMRTVMVRGDVNGDGALDAAELRSIATAQPLHAAQRGFGGGSYLVGDQVELSSRTRIEGAIEDLRLDSDRKQQAMSAAIAYADNMEPAARADLITQLATVLNASQLADFTARLDTQGRMVVRTAGPAGDGTRLKFVGPAALVGRMNAMLLEQSLDQFLLSPAVRAQAAAAIEQYRTRLKLGDTERLELAARLKDVLTTDERADLMAALTREPVAASPTRHLAFNVIVTPNGGAFFGGNAVGELRPVVVTPAVLVSP